MHSIAQLIVLCTVLRSVHTYPLTYTIHLSRCMKFYRILRDIFPTLTFQSAMTRSRPPPPHYPTSTGTLDVCMSVCQYPSVTSRY